MSARNQSAHIYLLLWQMLHIFADVSNLQADAAALMVAQTFMSNITPGRATLLVKVCGGNSASSTGHTVPWRATEVYCRPMQSQQILCVPNGTYLTSKELSWVQALASVTLNWKNIWIEKLCITLQMDVAGSKGDVCRVQIDLQAPNHTV